MYRDRRSAPQTKLTLTVSNSDAQGRIKIVPFWTWVLAQWRAVWFDCVFGVVPKESIERTPDLLTDLAGRNSKPRDADREPEQ